MFAVPLTKGRAAGWIAKRWTSTVTRLCGVDVDLRLPEAPLDAPAYLVMANHTSHFDVMGLYSTLEIDMKPVAKQSLGHIPLFGWALRSGAAIMIDRRDRERAVASIERAGRTIRGGKSVLMFPEGTRTPAGELGPLKKGPFHLALAARVPILPIGISGTGEILKTGDWKIRPGKVVIRVGDPLETTSFEDSDEGRSALMNEVGTALKQLMRDGP